MSGERGSATSAAVGSANQQVAAFVRELAHALERLDHHDEDPPLDYAAEELVAESVALCVCRFLGWTRARHSMPYLTVWFEPADPDAFERIAALVDRLARRLDDGIGPAPRANRPR